MDTRFDLLPPTQPAPEPVHERLNTACTTLDAPVAVLDLHALSANAHDLVDRAHGKPIRLASKSIRSVAVLKALLATPGFNGVLAYSLDEAIMLVREGVTEDVVVGYPTVAARALAELVSSFGLLSAITIMIDHPDQLQAVLSAATPVAPVRVCLDLDMSLKLGPVHIGARRSPIHHAAQAQAAAEYITASGAFRLVGLMGYEAQIAGVTDDNPAVVTMKRLSASELSVRRPRMVAAVQYVLTQRGLPALEFINGGGTGSIESTASDASVTEVAAGSGLYGPHLFDRYQHFAPRPAAFFGLDVVRIPSLNTATVHGGGWVASGAPGPDRLPQPVYPPGLRYSKTEGAGEVQTPLHTTTHPLRIGDRVWFRHTKAGELAEHVTHFHIITHHRITARVTTYRGDGHAFL